MRVDRDSLTRCAASDVHASAARRYTREARPLLMTYVSVGLLGVVALIRGSLRVKAAIESSTLGDS